MSRYLLFLLLSNLLCLPNILAQVQQCACVENIPDIQIWDGASCNEPVSMRSGYSDHWECNSEPFNLQWDFGDGTTLPASTFNDIVYHVYSTNGTYEVNFSYDIIDANGVLCTQFHESGQVEIEGCENDCEECELGGEIELLSLVNGCIAQFYLGNLTLDPNCAWFEGTFDWYVDGEFYGSSGPYPEMNYEIDLYSLPEHSYVQVQFSAACQGGGIQNYSLSTYVEHPDCDCNCFSGVDYTLYETSGSNGVGCQQNFFFDPFGFDSNCGEIIDAVWYVDGSAVLTTEGQGFNNAILNFESDGIHSVLVGVNYLCSASNSMSNYYFALPNDDNNSIDIEGCNCDCVSYENLEVENNLDYCSYEFRFAWDFDSSCGQRVADEYRWFIDGTPAGTTSDWGQFGSSEYTFFYHVFDADGTYSVHVEYDIICDDGTISTHTMNTIVEVEGCNSDPDGECDCISDIVLEYIDHNHPEGSNSPCLSYATIDFVHDESCGLLNDSFRWYLNGELLGGTDFSSDFGTQSWGLYLFEEDGVYNISVEFEIKCFGGALSSYTESEFIAVNGCGPPQGTDTDDPTDGGNQIPTTDGWIGVNSGTDTSTDSDGGTGQLDGGNQFPNTDDWWTTSTGTDTGISSTGSTGGTGQTSGGPNDGGHPGGLLPLESDGGNHKADLMESSASRLFTVYPSILKEGESPKIATTLNHQTLLEFTWMSIRGEVLETETGIVNIGAPFCSQFAPNCAGTYLLMIQDGKELRETMKVVFY